MIRRFSLLALVSVLLPVGLARRRSRTRSWRRSPRRSSRNTRPRPARQLAQQKSQPPTGQKAQMEQRAVQALRNDPQMRTAFINRVAAPIANKLFECGMIP